MRLRLGLLLVILALCASLALAADLQIWPKIEGLPNFYVGLPDSINGQHPIDRESYGEGWFWMAAYDDGAYSFANFMISNIGPGDNKGTVDFTLWEPDGNTYLDRVPFHRGSVTTAKDRLDVTVGKNRVWGSHPNFNVKVNTDKLGADLAYKAELPGFAVNSGRVVYGDVDDYYSVYTTIPRAKISGTLRTPKGTRQVTGRGYSDHGIVTMLPHHYSKAWHTLRCFDDKYTFDILEFTTPGKWGAKRVALTILGKDGKILYGGSRYTLTPSGIKKDAKFGLSYGTRYDFAIDRPGKVKMDGHFSIKKQMHAIDLLSQLSLIERKVAALFSKSYILRFVVEVQAEVTLPDGSRDTFTAPGVAEVIHLR
ncbi:MAG: hypothetical protein P9L99_02975 [Candidatus Lernaella stagnicola]|nr:hypothetical protein [Candidatus Lernaella stagnicola]